MSDFDKNNGNSKPKSPKFISFLLLLSSQVILSDLQL